MVRLSHFFRTEFQFNDPDHMDRPCPAYKGVCVQQICFPFAVYAFSSHAYIVLKIFDRSPSSTMCVIHGGLGSHIPWRLYPTARLRLITLYNGAYPVPTIDLLDSSLIVFLSIPFPFYLDYFPSSSPCCGACRVESMSAVDTIASELRMTYSVFPRRRCNFVSEISTPLVFLVF